MELLGNEAQVVARFNPFGDRCTICAEHTIGSELVLEAPNGTPW
jgi:hypothetical protein